MNTVVRPLRRLTRSAFLLFALALIAAPAIRAQTLTLPVRSSADSGPETLRWAIENATGTYNYIVFQPETDGIPVRLESPLPPITRTSLVGRPSRTIIDGSLVGGDGIQLLSGGIRWIHTRNFKSGAGIVLGSLGGEIPAAAEDVTSTGNRIGLRLSGSGTTLDFSVI